MNSSPLSVIMFSLALFLFAATSTLARSSVGHTDTFDKARYRKAHKTDVQKPYDVYDMFEWVRNPPRRTWSAITNHLSDTRPLRLCTTAVMDCCSSKASCIGVSRCPLKRRRVLGRDNEWTGVVTSELKSRWTSWVFDPSSFTTIDRQHTAICCLHIYKADRAAIHFSLLDLLRLKNRLVVYGCE
jgi:hypothetical protein